MGGVSQQLQGPPGCAGQLERWGRGVQCCCSLLRDLVEKVLWDSINTCLDVLYKYCLICLLGLTSESC